MLFLFRVEIKNVFLNEVSVLRCVMILSSCLCFIWLILFMIKEVFNFWFVMDLMIVCVLVIVFVFFLDFVFFVMWFLKVEVLVSSKWIFEFVIFFYVVFIMVLLSVCLGEKIFGVLIKINWVLFLRVILCMCMWVVWILWLIMDSFDLMSVFKSVDFLVFGVLVIVINLYCVFDLFVG